MNKYLVCPIIKW